MPYDHHCKDCPYNNQKHLADSTYFLQNLSPVELEDNESNVLLVFQAPGIREWELGKPIQPTIKRGGTAGRRIEMSWERKHKKRRDFNIINSVQCFPGNAGDGDKEPHPMAVCCCSKRLLQVLNSKNYTKVIAFGDIAFQVVSTLINALSPQPILIPAPHPNNRVKGRRTSATLDTLW